MSWWFAGNRSFPGTELKYQALPIRLFCPPFPQSSCPMFSEGSGIQNCWLASKPERSACLPLACTRTTSTHSHTMFFYTGSQGLSSCPHTCKASTFLTEPSSPSVWATLLKVSVNPLKRDSFGRKMVYHVTVPEINRIGPCVLDFLEKLWCCVQSQCLVYELSQLFWHTFLIWMFLFSIFLKCSAWVLLNCHPHFFPFSHNVISLCNLIRLYNYSNKHSWQEEVGEGVRQSCWQVQESSDDKSRTQ